MARYQTHFLCLSYVFLCFNDTNTMSTKFVYIACEFGGEGTMYALSAKEKMSALPNEPAIMGRKSQSFWGGGGFGFGGLGWGEEPSEDPFPVNNVKKKAPYVLPGTKLWVVATFCRGT